MKRQAQNFCFLGFIRAALRHSYSLSGNAGALYAEEESVSPPVTISDAHCRFRRIIPQTGWVYSLYISGEQRFETLETADFAFIHAAPAAALKQFVPKEGLNIREVEHAGGGGLYAAYSGDMPSVSELPGLLREARKAHPLARIQTHDRSWIEHFEKAWQLFVFTEASAHGPNSAKLYHWIKNVFGQFTPPGWKILSAESIQAYWDVYGRPLYEYLWQRRWRQGDDDLYDFVLSALYHNPWWIGHLFSLLKKVTAGSADAVLFRLLELMGQKFSIAGGNGEELFRINGPARQTFIFSGDSFRLRGSYGGKKQHRSLEWDSGKHAIRLDRQVSFSALEEKKKIRILPEFPLLLRPDYPTAQLALAGYTLEIPLVWRQFTLHCDGIRFKFLLKAAHWQITIKWNRETESVRLNGKIIKKETVNNRQTVYLPRGKTESGGKLLFFDMYGRRIKQKRDGQDIVLLAGMLNKDGLLVEEGRLRRKGAGSSRAVSLIRPEPISDSIEGRELILPKGRPVPLSLERTENPLERLKGTGARELEAAMALCAPEGFREAFYKKTGLSPLAIPYDALDVYEKSLGWIIIVGRAAPEGEERDLSLCTMQKKGSCRLIWVKEEKSDIFLEKYFGRELQP